MKEWQFFLETKETSQLIPVKSQDSHLLRGCYRIIAQTYLSHNLIDVRLDYQPREGEQLYQKYQKVTPIDGWLIVTPFLELTEGELQLRCQADVLAELSGNYWQKYLTIFITNAEEVSPLTQQQPNCELILTENHLIKSAWGKLLLSGEINLVTSHLSQAILTYELYNPKTGTRLVQKQQDLDIAYLPGKFELNLEINPYWNTCLILGQVHLDVIYTDSRIRTSVDFQIISHPSQILQKFKQLQYQLEPSGYPQLKLIDFNTKKPNQLPDLPKNHESEDLQQAFAALELDKRFWLRLNQLANQK